MKNQINTGIVVRDRFAMTALRAAVWAAVGGADDSNYVTTHISLGTALPPGGSS